MTHPNDKPTPPLDEDIVRAVLHGVLVFTAVMGNLARRVTAERTDRTLRRQDERLN